MNLCSTTTTFWNSLLVKKKNKWKKNSRVGRLPFKCQPQEWSSHTHKTLYCKDSAPLEGPTTAAGEQAATDIAVPPFGGEEASLSRAAAQQGLVHPASSQQEPDGSSGAAEAQTRL